MNGAPGLPDDIAYMRRAIELAARGWGRVAPNPLVGAVIVRDGEVVGEGWHTEYGQAHAEVEAIRAAGDRTLGSTLYVTLEPCRHHGKTGPCTEAIVAAGISRVVFASPDPTPAGGGAEILRGQGIEVIGGVADEEARRLNRAFFRAADPERGHLPWTELKLAISIDGRVTDSRRVSKWITGARAREEVHRMRANVDAIAVGVGTAIADDPSLTVRGSVKPRVPPVRVIFDRHLRLPRESQLVRTAREVPLWVVCARGAPASARAGLEAAGVRILEADDLTNALTRLRREGVLSILFEGGAQLAAALLDTDLVDRLSLFIAPLLLGPGGESPFDRLRSVELEAARRWSPVRTESLGPDTLIILER